MKNADILKEALDMFTLCEDNETQNRKDFREDIKFARLSEQWPPEVKTQRQRENRPCLTVNRVAPVIRQVVNDARLNRPAITVRPVDSNADKETAEIITGLIRNIEQASDADTAYDTAIDNAVSGGFGYFRINLDYANDVDPDADLGSLSADAFAKDIKVERVINPLSVYGDPASTAATSEDWNVAFVIEDMPREAFRKKYPKANLGGFFGTDNAQQSQWVNDKTVRVAEYWKREKTERLIVAVQYPEAEVAILAMEDYEKRRAEIEAAGGMLVGPPRAIPSYTVTQYKITATEVLETNRWLGKFIPIVPVYGDEVYSEGRRYLRSLIRDAKDPNRNFNYWRSAATELVALAPKAPWLIEEGAIVDEGKWETANTHSWPYLEYKKGFQMPQRNALATLPAGALQEALNASDDIKAVTGIYDASLGARSNETSGKAISARQREGDVSSFHFIDNLSRSIRHAGRIILDLIPKVYSTPRIIRVLGEDGEAKSAAINGMQPPEGDDQAQKVQGIYDLRVGRYDLAVSAGPSFTTRREEAATQMIELIRSYPDSAPVIGDLLAKNLDWPGADEIAKRLEKMLPPQVREDGAPDPQAQAAMQQAQQAVQIAQQLQQELQQAKDDRALKERELEIKAYEAQTARIQAEKPEFVPQGLPQSEGQVRANLFGA